MTKKWIDGQIYDRIAVIVFEVLKRVEIMEKHNLVAEVQ